MRKTWIRGYWQNDCWWVMAVITTGVCVSPSRFINCLSYYVLAMNAGSLGGNRYVNFTLSGLVDIPSLIICFFLIKRFAVCKCSSIISRPQMRNRVLVRSTDGFTCLSEQISNRFMHAQDFIRPLWIEEHQPNCMFTDLLTYAMSCILDCGTHVEEKRTREKQVILCIHEPGSDNQ